MLIFSMWGFYNVEVDELVVLENSVENDDFTEESLASLCFD